MSGVSIWRDLEQRLTQALNVARRPVSVSFLDAPPAGVGKFSGSEPSGCSFWRLASEGRVFYTVPADHFNCPVGCYTHNIPLSPERENEAGETLNMMFELGYVRPEELPRIPRLAKTPAATVYAPLGESPVAPDVVMISAKPSAAMLLNEAALRAGCGTGAAALGRPTCMALPAALQHGALVSLGCIGNRIYTGLGEDEL
jgi:uncharacterized protein (DUF169 family)